MAKFCIAIHSGPYSPKLPGEWTYESALMDRADIAKAIHSGDIGIPDRVLEIDEATGTVTNITDDIAIDVSDITWGLSRQPFPELIDWLDQFDVGYFKELVR